MVGLTYRELLFCKHFFFKLQDSRWVKSEPNSFGDVARQTPLASSFAPFWQPFWLRKACRTWMSGKTHRFHSPQADWNDEFCIVQKNERLWGCWFHSDFVFFFHLKTWERCWFPMWLVHIGSTMLETDPPTSSIDFSGRSVTGCDFLGWPRQVSGHHEHPRRLVSWWGCFQVASCCWKHHQLWVFLCLFGDFLVILP